MKCPTCGANLQIEDEKCPFCGNPNPFAQKHRQDMRYYHQEFQKTKQEVEKKTRHFNAVTAKITVIAVLFVMVFGMAFMLREGAYYVWSGRVKKDIERNAQHYADILEKYEQEGSWRELHAFYEAKNLNYTNHLHEYMVLYYAIYDYKSVLDYITRYKTEPEYYTADRVSAQIAEGLDSFYKSVERTTYESTYYDDNYRPEHMEAYARIREDLETVLRAYCHLTEEELAVLPDYSVAKKGSLIEDGLLRENSVDNGEAEEE